MTEENYNYRTSEMFLRNQFKGTGEFNIPIIPKAEFRDDELENLLLIGFDKAINDKNNFDRIVHFFLYDYKFENIWKKPDSYIEKLKNYIGVLSPDFSMYIEMNRTLKLYNTFRNRWCGAYLASKGIKVIPTVNWGNEDTFDFCFDGIPKGSIVAVSTYMVREHNNHSDQKEFFMKGYNEMLRRIEPSKIICYSEPFPEMKGDIIYVDYALSSWKYQKSNSYNLPKSTKNGKIIYKTMVQPQNINNLIWKGSGSAYGGKWKPKKEDDERFLGKPGEIKETFDKNGERRLTKIGDDGRAVKERHFSDHKTPWKHTNPHDHKINWEYPKKGIPNFEKPHINYDGDVPEFKIYYMGGSKNMAIIDEYKFETISEFKDCIIRGGEIVFQWKDKCYSAFSYNNKFLISEAYKEETEKLYDTPDDLLEYEVSGDRLRDVITQVEVTERTL